MADPAHLLLRRLLGSAFLMFAVLAWKMRAVRDAAALQGVCSAFTVGSVVGAIASLHAVLTGVVNPFGWSSVLVAAARATPGRVSTERELP